MPAVKPRKSKTEAAPPNTDMKKDTDPALPVDTAATAAVVASSVLDAVPNASIDLLDGADIDLQPVEINRRPADQIDDLTDEQLNEVFTKVITATNPNALKSVTRFHFKEQEFKLDASVQHMAVHFSMDGCLIHVDSQEAKRQLKEQSSETELASVGTSTAEDGEGEEGHGKVLRNQFNFSERASQTYNNPMRHREVATEPPPTVNYNVNVTKWSIFDTYIEDMRQQMLAKQKAEQSKAKYGADDGAGDEEEDSGPSEEALARAAMEKRMGSALKIMERMVNHNAELDCFQDYKYYEDTNEHEREDHTGSFYPLWRFTYGKAKRKTVTGIAWNPQFTDLFAVGYGSYDFLRQEPGMICCFSLKNTSFPEYSFATDSGVMCLDFHPEHTSLLAAGLYDGTVCVYDVRSKSGTPIYVSSNPKTKHTDPVWQVLWQKSPPNMPLNFCSVSSDGRVTKWIMTKNELVNEEVVALKLNKPQEASDEEADDDNTLVGLGGGCCFDFNKQREDLFIVGTEEGSLRTYSKAYGSQGLRAYEGHNMAVYAARWNPFHPDVFLTCSADWTVKLWERNTKKPVMTFDLHTSVADVAWAPFSSTVFAVVTDDGKLRLYDLSVNKHEPLGQSPRVNKKAKLTHICFNPTQPIICVGDDRGVVNILKLSSNLRKMSAPKLEDLEPKEERDKLDRLLIIEEDKDAVAAAPAASADTAQASTAA